MASLKGQLALITGATSGIGWATAQALAAAGCDLVITGRRQERLNTLQKELRALGGSRVEALCFDVRNRRELETLFEKSVALLKETRILVNNAGLARGVDPLPKGAISDWEEMIDTNVKGLLYITRLLLPFMVERKQGDIVNIGSVAGRWVYPGGAVYCASKFAVRALSEGLRMDVQGTGIRVCNIEPGMVETEFSEVRLRDKEKAKSVYAGTRPLQAADIAQSVIWCLQAPRHVNVQELVIFPTDQAGVGFVHRQ